ncbi:MAG: hypothetical protein HC923_13190, partial [Myxococcales bacterium]|nr:hypothetical protein [Myxococcales bacterium]
MAKWVWLAAGFVTVFLVLPLVLFLLSLDGAPDVPVARPPDPKDADRLRDLVG